MCLSFGRRAETCCPVTELRQYTLKPDARETLIELFEREFIEPQEALGMRLLGQFRDLDRPDRFVWLRGFSDMAARKEALTAFYGGPVWKAHREAANATMINSDNVLLLKPAHGDAGFGQKSDRDAGLIIALVQHLAAPATKLAGLFREANAVHEQFGAKRLADFVTEASPNTFPRLPVREGESVWITFLRFSDEPAHERYAERLAQSRRGQTTFAALKTRTEPEVLRLEPTPRSRLR